MGLIGVKSRRGGAVFELTHVALLHGAMLQVGEGGGVEPVERRDRGARVMRVVIRGGGSKGWWQEPVGEG